MSKYDQLVTKLKEIFQIDRPELDFGIYRILNARADEINDYLNNTLKTKIQAALTDAGNANKADLEKQLEDAINGAKALGVEPDIIPKVQTLKAQITTASKGATEHENSVFSHLLTFFSRYYDNGDFISKRRYKGDTYAIPYSGEEVMLHWANKDQYYIKSGENFTNYSFKLDDGRKVSFKLLNADTAKDNRKDNDADRRFVLIEPSLRTFSDENGEFYQQECLPVNVINTRVIIDGKEQLIEELIINFEYQAMKKGTKQDALVVTAVQKILADKNIQSTWADLSKRSPTEKNSNRTELERHLSIYTQRNTADYFIHKNLNRFLSNELDFYIKNEVMNLDNIQNSETFSDIEKQLRMIQCLRSVAQDLIAFLSQLENFQKKLWTKKKFICSSHYLISTSILPSELYEIIIENDAQWIEWYDLGFVEDSLCDRKSQLNQLNLIVDTKFFNHEFKAKALSAFENIDQDLNGTLIHSDNFQAINLIKKKYSKKVDLVYIDPPYNTNSTPILYKNEYKRSSWASLMENRLESSMSLLRDNGVKAVAIDDSEVTNLSRIMESLSDEHRLTRVTVVHNPKGSITKDFNRTHEYCLFLTKESDKQAIGRTLEKNEKPRKMRRWGENSLRTERRLSFYPIYVNDGAIVRIGTVPDDSFHPEGKNVIQPDGTIEIWPIDQNGEERRWNFGLDSIEENLDRVAVIAKDNQLDLFVTHEKTVPKTVWSGGEFDAGRWGNSLLIKMLGRKLFDFPKSINLVKRCIELTTQNNPSPLVLDYFAGSGTTAHAVIEHNAEHKGKSAKFIVVEQGQYFESVTKPRILKAAFASEWNDGIATSPRNNAPLFAKVIKVESYEDTLNNIKLQKPQATSDLFSNLASEFEDEYLIKYMLEEQSRGSLLSTDDFKNPFNYAMNITTDSAGATEHKSIDLVETFNYLIGLHVKTIDSMMDLGYVRIEGTLPSGESTLVLWRDCDKIGYDELDKYADSFNIYSKEQTYDVIYINGDHNLPTSSTHENDGDDITHTLKLRQIEPEFLSLMFSEEA